MLITCTKFGYEPRMVWDLLNFFSGLATGIVVRKNGRAVKVVKECNISKYKTI